MLTIQETADRLNLSAKSVRRRIERGTLQSVRRDGRRLIPLGAVQELEASQKSQAGVEVSPRALVPREDDLAVVLARLEALAAENGRFRALQEVAETTRQQIEAELIQTRAKVTELEAQLAERAAQLATVEAPRRRWFSRS